MALRPETTTPNTGQTLNRDQLNAEVAHEGTLRYFVENTELSVLNEDQRGIISLVESVQTMGLQLPATSKFFTADENSIKALSSANEGMGRIQAKECITAGAFPMSLLFKDEKRGIIDTITGLFGKKQPQEPQR